MSESHELTPRHYPAGTHPGAAHPAGAEPVRAESTGVHPASLHPTATDSAAAHPAGTHAARTHPGAAYAHDAMDEIDLLDLVKVVWRARWVIVGVALVAVIAAFGFTVTQERVYESIAVFAIQSRPMPVGISQGSQAPAQNIAVLAGILRSRQLAETVVDSLSLIDVWETSGRQAAIKRLQGAISVNANDRDGIITVSFKDTDPALARDIVANYVTLFEERANELNVTEADHVVAFAQDRLAQVESQLVDAETSLRDFKERYGIVSFQQQTQSLVNAHAALTDRIRTLTVELIGKRSYLTDRDPEVQALLGRIAELERQARALETGNSNTNGNTSDAPAAGPHPSTIAAVNPADPPVPSTALTADFDQTLSFDFGLRESPGIAMQLERLEREVALQREMYELLRQQYEAARLDASRKVNIARLIDPPEAPHEPVSRGLMLNVALAGFVGVFVTLMFAFVAELLRQRAQDEDVVRDLPFLRHFRGRETTV